MYKIIRDFFYGLAFGITETIPGVSAGTIAIILGFYFELIETINHFTQNIRKSLKFLVPLIIGIVAGVVLFSSLIHYLLSHYSFPVMLFFIGLIAGIIPHIFFKVKERGRKPEVREIALIVIPLVLLVLLSTLKGVTAADPEEVMRNINIPFMVFIFFTGILAAAALVIPGISGSFVMLLLGIYPLVIYAVSSIRIFFADPSDTALLLNICKVLTPLAIGVIIGGLSMVRLIEKLLKNYHKTVYAIILGLLLGSVCVLAKDPMVYKSGISAIIVIAGIAAFAAGTVLSYRLGKKRL